MLQIIIIIKKKKKKKKKIREGQTGVIGTPVALPHQRVKCSFESRNVKLHTPVVIAGK